MGTRYAIGAGITLEDALAELRNDGRVIKPDLVLLDLYYGPETRKEMRNEIEKADDELSIAEDKLRKLLEEARQSPDGGFELAEQVHAQIPTSARAFFSRKAFLKDALNAQKKELPLVEKPDPDEGDRKMTNTRVRCVATPASYRGSSMASSTGTLFGPNIVK
jgi:hypothetical protein